MPNGIYISVPFCRTKCSFCNFASGVFSREAFDRYIDRIADDIANLPKLARHLRAEFDRAADSIYLGGGTPSVLAPEQLVHLFDTVRANFDVTADAEVTVECAPGTLSIEMIDTLQSCGVNRVSLGVQSFVDQESRSVGRLHTRNIVLTELARLGDAGLNEVSVDLIAGLPYQTKDSWAYSIDQVLDSGVPHVSVYILEVDEDSRLGRELIAGGTRYHAHHVPDDDLAADFYEYAVAALAQGGVEQYEISNFARPGHRSRHNMKYWTRQPYLGFGVEAHSMLPAPIYMEPHRSVRFANTDNLDEFLAAKQPTSFVVSEQMAIEEMWFLGLRLNKGIDLDETHVEYGIDAVEKYRRAIIESVQEGLLELKDGFLRLTPRGRLLSNIVFERFISTTSEESGSKPEQDAPLLRILR